MDKDVLKFKKHLEDKYNVSMTYEDATESMRNFCGFFMTLYKIDQRLKKYK
ncbi:MAG: hypothetical protein HN833_02470 [Elusimicrobiaceae bacterium]|jgi:hypothetical protein|nr:hypothetical protein [Elusimicrobiaceae bacterium]MBT3954843.1 hypothetical protein [Elusimicrobiaceae bacterium]MBT4008410.1 hypothetical protein [Elusimicrobiaceae bacterium]MBT4402938.1 hypothetical protein [Elusimicrobiaceae bacterium]MBT4439874.1 hypothetical protein [Elusimicrobiaceae bacterium]